MTLFNFRFWKRWSGLGLVFYDYDGNDGRKVTDWILHLGFVWIIKNRTTRRTWMAPMAIGWL